MWPDERFHECHRTEEEDHARHQGEPKMVSEPEERVTVRRELLLLVIVNVFMNG